MNKIIVSSITVLILLTLMILPTKSQSEEKESMDPLPMRLSLDLPDEGKTKPNIKEETEDHEVEIEVKDDEEDEEEVNDDDEEEIKIKEEVYTKEKEYSGMIFIKGDCFEMGDTFGGGSSDEIPVHEVCLDDYYLSDHEVTQGEWDAVMDNNPYYFKSCGKDCPVETVSWDDVQNFIEKLNKKTSLKYRLPTEAEWEYAARSGGKKEEWSGTNSESSLGDFAWYYSNSNSYTHQVKTRKPNGLGIYDMSGNIWEWVSDWYALDYYKKSPRNNPKGPNRGLNRVNRGGSWVYNSGYSRASGRFHNSSDYRDNILGFRLAKSL